MKSGRVGIILEEVADSPIPSLQKPHEALDDAIRSQHPEWVQPDASCPQ